MLPGAGHLCAPNMIAPGQRSHGKGRLGSLMKSGAHRVFILSSEGSTSLERSVAFLAAQGMERLNGLQYDRSVTGPRACRSLSRVGEPPSTSGAAMWPSKSHQIQAD